MSLPLLTNISELPSILARETVEIEEKKTTTQKRVSKSYKNVFSCDFVFQTSIFAYHFGDKMQQHLYK